jgi:hypothetical protein
MKQQSLAAQGVFEKYGRKSRREQFLAKMETVVPWSAMESLVRPHYADLAAWNCTGYPDGNFPGQPSSQATSMRGSQLPSSALESALTDQ